MENLQFKILVKVKMNETYKRLIDEKLQNRPEEIKNKFKRIIELCGTLSCDSVMEDIHNQLRGISVRHPEINEMYDNIL